MLIWCYANSLAMPKAALLFDPIPPSWKKGAKHVMESGLLYAPYCLKMSQNMPPLSRKYPRKISISAFSLMSVSLTMKL
ncbi:Uncharacterised protein [Vibrio cholerae]|uniref:Uncharacterized protein n=1 Tax=Vibrio cholerae TaxID=666 RepID=A0A655Z262_VIBCL|nr:Uncharacterised protein [Vibrio cholerae]CSA91692.1 Uncharacterised protein [Vibrio cholerae]CSB24990.1 Uncharacterised protein [Vibrio cholerae]CSB56506.1 Uncharacterised protein [Vibrio cholerae]CSB89361.1 Uncharacterised protein [Vibrio cholerae]